MKPAFMALTMFLILATTTGCRVGNPAGTDTDVLEIPYRTDTPFMIHPPVYRVPLPAEK